jgi:hypothetical protein
VSLSLSRVVALRYDAVSDSVVVGARNAADDRNETDAGYRVISYSFD